MANEVLKGIAEDIKKINEQIIAAEELISVANEAGEDTSTFEQDLRTLRIRKDKWERVLQNRGIIS